MRVATLVLIIIAILLLFHFWGRVKNTVGGAGIGGGSGAPGSGVPPVTKTSLGGCGCAS